MLPRTLKCFRQFWRGRILPLQQHTQNHASVSTRDYQGLLLLVSWRVRSFKFHSSLSWDTSVSGTRIWTKIHVKSCWTPLLLGHFSYKINRFCIWDLLFQTILEKIMASPSSSRKGKEKRHETSGNSSV